MNVFAARVALRPRTLTEVLDLAAPFCLHNAGLIGRMSLVTLLPLAGLAAGLRLGLGWSWPAVWTVLVLAAGLGEGLYTVALGEALFRDPAEVRVGPVLGRFLRRLPALVAAHVCRLVVLAACALVVLPLFLEGQRWLFPVEAVLLENARTGEAIRRSRSLGGRRSGFCLGLGLALLAMPVAAVLLVDRLGDAVVSFVLQLGQPLGSLFSDGGSAFAVLGLLLAMPLSAAMRFLGYIDLRTRSEGWDIQLRFSAWSDRERSRGGDAGSRAA